MTETATAAPAETVRELCRWHGCTRLAALRRGKTGPAPAYCEQADDGGPEHNPLNAWRAKKRISDPQAGRTPVAEAVATAGNALDRAEQLSAALRETAEHLAEALRDAADPVAIDAQIFTQVSDARAEAAQARADADRDRVARITAEATAREATQAAEAMAAQAEAAQADADAARAEMAEVRADAQARIELAVRRLRPA